MEIERVVTGDLNKSLEQCVNALIDVERKVAQLKNELVQTIQSVPNARSQPLVQGWPGQSVPAFPQYAAPQGTYGTPVAPGVTQNPYAPVFGAPFQGPVTGFAPVYAPFGTPFATPFATPYPAPFGTMQNLPYANQSPVVGHAPNSPYAALPHGALPFGTLQHGTMPHAALPYGSVQGFAPVQNFGHIW